MLRTLSKSVERAVIQWINIDRYLPLQIDITNACNLRCKHCYHPHHQNTGAIEFADWIQILDQYEALVERLRFRPYVIICGGEPFLSKHFEPILSDLVKRRFEKVSILSNGTMITPGKIKQLKQFNELNIQISLDGPDEPTHDAVRGAGSFQKSMRGIQLLRQNGIDVQILAVLSKRSAAFVSDFFDLAKTVDVTRMGFTRLIVEGQAKNLVSENEDRPLEPLELREAYKSIVREAARTGLKTSTMAPLFHLVHPGLGRNGKFAEGIVIDYQGNYLASSRSRLVLGNALQDRIEDIFLKHPLLQRLRRKDVKICGTCPHYAVCGGDRNVAFAATGDFLGTDPGCWLQFETKQKQIA